MRIVIDARMLSYTGIGRYASSIIDLIPGLDPGNEYVVLLLPADMSWEAKSPNVQKVQINSKPYSIGEQIVLPWKLFGLQADLVHFPHFNAPILYLKHHIVTIHDLTLRDFPTRRGNGPLQRLLFGVRYWAMRFSLRRSVVHAAAILTPTRFVRDQIRSTWSIISDDKVVATHEAVATLDVKPTKPENMKSDVPFLLYAGNYYPSKNVGRLLETFDLLRHDNPKLQLVLVGKEDYFQQRLKEQAKRLGFGDAIVFTGFVPDSELVWYYDHAKLFVFPSLSEGFGLTPLEAMAAGTPVISSNASCMPEVLGEAAAYFDPTDPSSMATGISALLDDPKELDRLRTAGTGQAKKYSWHKFAQETLAVYKSTLKK